MYHRTGIGRFRHPIVGDLALIYEDLDVAADPGQTILAFTAEPDPESRAALDRLDAWGLNGAPPS